VSTAWLNSLYKLSRNLCSVWSHACGLWTNRHDVIIASKIIPMPQENVNCSVLLCRLKPLNLSAIPVRRNSSRLLASWSRQASQKHGMS